MTFNPPSGWSIDGNNGVLRAARIGQEFIVAANDGITDWAHELFAGA
jgi:hypothetical protein